MPLVHEVYTQFGFAGIKHVRETVRPSGLVVPVEIARSLAEVRLDKWLEQQNKSGLQLPTLLPPTIELPTTASSRIECEDTEAFVNKGVDAWRGALAVFGDSVTRVSYRLIEKSAPVEEQATKLIIPGVEPEYTFLGYVGTTDEIQTIKRIVSDVNRGLGDKDVPGNYL